VAKAVITPLTGVRFVAALWVVLFHVYLYNGPGLAAAHPVVDAVVGPLVSQGDLGVDLFFLLSGFVLAHNYLERLGPRPALPQALRFLGLRIARVWPLYLLAVLGGGLLLFLREQWWGSTPNVPISWGRFLEQVLMVQQWGAANVPDTSWTGPAWSISAEWLAYLSFPLLAVLVWRIQRYAGPVAVLALAGGVLVPVLIWTTVAHTQAAPFMWLARLASEFVCGMLLAAAPTYALPRVRAAAARLTPVAVAAGAAWLYLADLLGRPSLGPLVLALFPVLVLGLAVGNGALHQVLGSRELVLGGEISFALYLVHVPLLKLFRDALDHGAVPLDPADRLYGELVVVLLSLLLAYVLYRRVEEPARHRLRALGPRLTGVPAALRRLRVPSAARMGRAPQFSEYGVQQQAPRVLV
jgi:peptidoglycan/LPS O-acetylase OafA/YrhL